MSTLDFKNPSNVLSADFSLDDPVLYSSFEFDSCMVITDSLTIGEQRLLEVDNPLIVPCSVGLRFLITSADVLHAWAVPELGIKVDAVPGRLSQFISMIRRPGVFFGQCSEICGVAHAFMPIVIHAHAYSYLLSPWSYINSEPVNKLATTKFISMPLKKFEHFKIYEVPLTKFENITFYAMRKDMASVAKVFIKTKNK